MAGPELLALADAQHYRLAFWREAATRINYRRFFDVSDLAALQADDPEVFDASHRLVLELVHAGQVTGLRIDHVDGLRDPKAYLDRLARASGRAYVVVEKILQRSEHLRRDWPVEGTTGYEFLDAAGGLPVDAGGARALGAFATRFVGVDVPFEFLVQAYKTRALDALFRADLDRLGRRLEQIARTDPDGVEVSHEELRLALAEVTAGFPSTARTCATSSRRQTTPPRSARRSAPPRRGSRPRPFRRSASFVGCCCSRAPPACPSRGA